MPPGFNSDDLQDQLEKLLSKSRRLRTHSVQVDDEIARVRRLIALHAASYVNRLMMSPPAANHSRTPDPPEPDANTNSRQLDS
jgi:hypothetical protein